MLKVDIKSKIYKMKNEAFKALDNVKFEIDGNGLVCILGPSGSGKTTLMNIIGALDSDFDGDVIINNKSIKEFKTKDLDNYRKNTIGFIFQQFYLINRFSAYDNVKVALNLSNFKDRKSKTMNLLKEVEMSKFAKRKVNVLSGGQKQRVAIARALANNSDVILADEPTGALDSKMSTEIMELLKKLSKTKLVLIITHSQELANQYADTIINMEDGKITGIESQTQDIKNNENVESNKKNEDKDEEKSKKSKVKKDSGMSFFKAFKYSLKNFTTRKARIIATAIGMSIGIVGIGMALALSNGTMNIAKSQVESIMPTNMITVTYKSNTNESSISNMMQTSDKTFKYSDFEYLKSLNSNVTHFWIVPSNVYKDWFTEISINKSDAQTAEYEDSSFFTNQGFQPYENVNGDLTLGRAPENKDELVLSLNTANFLLTSDKSLKLSDLINKDIYIKFGPIQSMGKEDDNNQILTFKIVGITSTNTTNYAIYQNSMDTLELYGSLYNMKKEDMKYVEAYMYLNKNLTSSQITDTIKDLNSKQDEFELTGTATTTLSSVETVLNVVKNVLIGFSSISVIVAILMIGIVIYISVIERISEIGILRAIGARKKDIRSIFLFDSTVIGILSGILGVAVTRILCVVVNKAIVGILGKYGMTIGNIQIADLSNTASLSLIAVCILLSIIAGIIPSQKAAKLDPIVALRRS